MKLILQVEDDPNDVFLLRHAMKKTAVENPVHVASDGQEAIDYLEGAGRFADRTKFPLPDLVLLDLKLPHVMGLEVLRQIRRDDRLLAIVVIVLTSSADEADRATAYRLGANAFLTKPSGTRELGDMVKALTDSWLNEKTLPCGPSHAEAVAPANPKMPLQRQFAA